MDQITVQTDDGPKTFSLDAVQLPPGTQLMKTSELSDNYVHTSVLKHSYLPKDELKNKLDDRFKNWVKRDEVESDEKVIQNILSKHGEAKVDIDQKERDWTEEKLVPRDAEIAKLRSTLIGRDIRKAAESVDVADQWSEPMKKGKPSYVELQYGDAIRYNPELGYAVAHDENGNPIQSANATNERPFQDAAEYFAGLNEAGVLDNYKRTPRKNSGIPAHSNGSEAGTPAPTRLSDMSDEDQANYIMEHGVEKYTALPD